MQLRLGFTRANVHNSGQLSMYGPFSWGKGSAQKKLTHKWMISLFMTNDSNVCGKGSWGAIILKVLCCPRFISMSESTSAEGRQHIKGGTMHGLICWCWC